MLHLRYISDSQIVSFNFQLLYHRGWIRAVEAAKSGLNASLLIRHPDTDELFVNFDPQVMELIQEAKCLQALNLDIPDTVKALMVKEEEIKKYHVE